MLNLLRLHNTEQSAGYAAILEGTVQHAEPRKCTKWQLLQMYQPSPPVKAVSTTECDAGFKEVWLHCFVSCRVQRTCTVDGTDVDSEEVGAQRL